MAGRTAAADAGLATGALDCAWLNGGWMALPTRAMAAAAKAM
jgi:hypothetical protein